MRRVLMTALATAALAVAASPASAAVVVVGGEAGVPSCAAWSFTQNETKCAGGYEGNLLKGSLQAPGLAAIQALGYSGSGAFLVKLENLNGASVLNFGQTLFGQTIIGIHYGAAGAKPEATSFFLFDFGAVGASSINITGRAGANALGTSNAVLFATGQIPPVPEPATWAMMLLGFGGIGMAIRRRRRAGALMQLA